jgi:3-oxoacyl-[acyl-carrier-protein] synthase II
MTERRVAITGIGIVSPIGNDLATAWKNVTSGVSGVGQITQFEVSPDCNSKIGAEVKDFNPENYVIKKDVKRYDRFSLFALASAKEAWADSGLAGHSYDPVRCGTILGVGIGGLNTLEENHKAMLDDGPRRVSPFLIPAMISNLAPGNIAIDMNLQGVNYVITSACTSGTHAIGEAYRMIKHGIQDVVLTGGAEAAITPLGVGGFARMRALSTRNEDPVRASRPFDKDRDGFVIGEGAAVLVLEEMESAKKRGAKIYAEVSGYGFSCDAHHITAPPEDGAGAKNCMKLALKDSGLNLEQVGYINAHGTSTPINDPAESRAIRSIFGGLADKGLMVSSTKSMTGHLLGAAGGVEGAFLAMALHTGIIPPTINLENPDEGCDLDYVPHTAREKSIEAAMSNSFGFGGTNASVVFRRV